MTEAEIKKIEHAKSLLQKVQGMAGEEGCQDF